MWRGDLAEDWLELNVWDSTPVANVITRWDLSRLGSYQYLDPNPISFTDSNLTDGVLGLVGSSCPDP